MRKLLRSMAKAAMKEAGISRMFKGSTFVRLWKDYAQHRANQVRNNLCEKPKISKIGRKATMLNRIESLKTDAEVARLIKRVGGLNGR